MTKLPPNKSRDCVKCLPVCKCTDRIGGNQGGVVSSIEGRIADKDGCCRNGWRTTSAPTTRCFDKLSA